MSKEIYISTTPHETRLAVVEDEQLAEIYFERENEYTLAGSIYNGKVTRVLPGMQSSFVDIGLERDAFLYVTDFMEEQGDAADFESDGGGSRRQQPPREASVEPAPSREGGRGRHERGDRPRRNDRAEQQAQPRPASNPTAPVESTTSFDEPIAPAPSETVEGIETATDGAGSRRWRGRRGRRRGRGIREEQPPVAGAETTGEVEPGTAENDVDPEIGFVEALDASSDGAIEITLDSEPTSIQPPQEAGERGGRSGRGRDRRGRNRRGRGDRDRGRDRGPARSRDYPEPAFDNSYAGYVNEDALPEATGEPVLLPGESIRKYRDPAVVAAEEAEARRNAPAAAQPLVVAAPSIEIVGWDGGSVLPGETLSRKRGTGNGQTGNRDKQRQSGRFDAVASPAAEAVATSTRSVPELVTPISSPETFTPAEAPEEPTGLTELPLHDTAQPVPQDDATAAPTDVAEMQEEIASQVSVDIEYEPEEGASATLGDTRRDLSRFEQTPDAGGSQQGEQATASDNIEEIAGNTPDLTTYDLQAAADAEPAGAAQEPVADPIPTLDSLQPEITSITADGEMFSPEPAPASATEAEANLPSQEELPKVEGTQYEAASPAREEEESDSTLQSTAAALESLEAEVHAYGDGDLEEEELDEEIDEEIFEYSAAPVHAEDGEVEYEEETLDDSADMGAVLHEMSQVEHGTDQTEDAEEFVSHAGGFTEADFGGEPETEDEEEVVGTTSAEGDQQQPSREGNRRPSSGRDRRGGRSSGGDRGRNGRRQSMQTTDLPAINELLKPGQEILVQIAKEPIAKKGARITSHIALPGRFLVFMPTVNHTGVSRKISSDEERRRLKSILLSEKGDAQGGFIVRTAADGASEEELRNDLRFLIQMWTDIKTRSESSKSPALIYHDLNLVERILRDQVTDNFSAIWVDTEQEYERVLRFLQRFQPSLVRRVKLYTKETPLFEHFGVTAEIDKALKSKVWLKSGGSIVINQTEALVAIDINTGKYVGKTARLEDTILKTNLDAIPEIVRQIRLRDLGGIIVIDFIDMDERKNRAKVMQALEDAMRPDRAPSKILPFNDFGLVIMTRKRVKQSLERTLCMPDPVTEGTGMIKSPITIANEIYVEMRKMHRHFEKSDVMLRVHPEVVKTLKANGGKRLQELEDMTRKTILVKSDPALSPEAFDIH